MLIFFERFENSKHTLRRLVRNLIISFKFFDLFHQKTHLLLNFFKAIIIVTLWIRCCPRRRSWPDFVWSLTLPRLAISFDHMYSFSPVDFFRFILDLFSPRLFRSFLPLLPSTSNSKVFTITFQSSFLLTVLPHTTYFSLSKDSSIPNKSISSSLYLRSNSFTPHIARIIALSVLLKIAISFSLQYQASLPYNIANLNNFCNPFLSSLMKTFCLRVFHYIS